MTTAGILSALQPASCASRSWPAPKVYRICLGNCMPAESCAAAGANGLSSGELLVYPISCSSDDPGAAAQIIDCLLFQKWRWEQIKPQLAAVAASRPAPVTAEEANAFVNAVRDSVTFRTVVQLVLDGSDVETWKRLNPALTVFYSQIDQVAAQARQLFARAKACVDWCASVHDLLDSMFDATNIRVEWLLGGLAPLGPADYTSRARSADPSIFPGFNAALVNLSQPGRKTAWPRIGYGAGSAAVGQPMGSLGKVIPPFWPADFGMYLASPSNAPTDWPLNLRAILGPMPARSLGGASAQRNPEWEAAFTRYSKLYMMLEGSSWVTGTLHTATADELAYYPSLSIIMDVWQALARDALTLPYENFVLGGIQRWSANMTSWAQAGLVNKSPSEFAAVAQAAITTQSRIATGLAISTAGGTATAVATGVNPVAGAVVGVVVAALAAITDLLFQLGAAAVGGWHCPQPLVRRSAGGACDFSQIMGPGAVERVADQARNVASHAQATAAADLLDAQQRAADARRKAMMPWLIGGVAALAAGAGYYLLKGK